MSIETLSNTVFFNVAAIVLLFVVSKFILKMVIKRLIRLAEDGDQEHNSRLEKRAETIGIALMSVGNIVIYMVILIMLLGIFGVDIRPILAGIGILGLAVGFGAQSLVKDFVTGLFIIIEGHYDVGDKVKIGSAEGRVMKLSMRSTVLQNDEGAMYYISNGSIKDVINYSQK